MLLYVHLSLRAVDLLVALALYGTDPIQCQVLALIKETGCQRETASITNTQNAPAINTGTARQIAKRMKTGNDFQPVTRCS
jgi:hypothetical protein